MSSLRIRLHYFDQVYPFINHVNGDPTGVGWLRGITAVRGIAARMQAVSSTHSAIEDETNDMRKFVDCDVFEAAFVNMIQNKKNLSYLDLAGLPWSTRGMTAVLQAVSHAAELEDVDFYHATTSIDWNVIAPAVAQMFRHNRALAIFDIRQDESSRPSNCRFGVEHKLLIMKAIKQYPRSHLELSPPSEIWSSITPLDLEFPPLSDSEDEEIAMRLGFFKRFPGITHWTTNHLLNAMDKDWDTIREQEGPEAFAMITHPRLGEHSLCPELPVEIARLIIEASQK
jgi:hypothetical protein